LKSDWLENFKNRRSLVWNNTESWWQKAIFIIWVPCNSVDREIVHSRQTQYFWLWFTNIIDIEDESKRNS
jgi:hypothetical protein